MCLSQLSISRTALHRRLFVCVSVLFHFFFQPNQVCCDFFLTPSYKYAHHHHHQHHWLKPTTITWNRLFTCTLFPFTSKLDQNNNILLLMVFFCATKAKADARKKWQQMKRVRTGHFFWRIEWRIRVRLNQVMTGNWRIFDKPHSKIPIELAKFPSNIHFVVCVVRTIGT